MEKETRQEYALRIMATGKILPLQHGPQIKRFMKEPDSDSMQLVIRTVTVEKSEWQTRSQLSR